MRITLLGTGSPIPDPRRAGPATLVTADGLTVLVDCGRGVLMRLAAAGSLPPFLDALLITHLHSDHISDLGDVITTRWVMSPAPLPFVIYGPVGTAEVVRLTLASLNPDVGYRIDHHADLHAGPAVEVREVGPGDSFAVGSATVMVGATDHRPVEPTIAFRIAVGGTSAVLGGDGVPCAGLDELCRGADAYVQTVIREDLVRLVPSAFCRTFSITTAPCSRRRRRRRLPEWAPWCSPTTCPPSSRARRTSGVRSPPLISPARSCWAMTSPLSISELSRSV